MSEVHPGANTIASVSDPLPSRFGRYEIKGIVGEGSMGRIYEAFDPLGNRTVAIKALRPDSFSSESVEDYLKRFRREAQAAGALSHPNIVTIYDVGEDYFVMELLQGRTLQTMLHESGRLDFGDALAILEPVAAALDYAHSHGVIHRDVKPANIIVESDSRVKLTDFGIAHLASTVMTASGMFLGSPCYMAPEQVQSSEASPRADLFSFAVVAYEALTGVKPFSGDAITSIVFQVVHVDPPPPTSHANTLPPWTDAVFERALSKDPQARFESGESFIRALRGLRIGGGGNGSVQTASGRIAIPATTSSSGRIARTALPAADPEETHDLRVVPDEPAWKKRWRVALWTAGGLALAAGGYLAALTLGVPMPKLPATTTSPDPTPPPVRGLLVETQPAGARVIVDGVVRGVAPLELADLPPGRHGIRLTLAGHAPTEVTLEPLPGTPPLLFRMQPLPKPTSAAQPSAPPAAPSPALVAETTTAIPTPAPSPAENPDEIYGPGSGMTLPVRLPEYKNASYPPEAERLKLQGTVGVEMIIEPDGRLSDIKVIESAGDILDRAMLDAVSQWRFKPATRSGKAVRYRLQWRNTFRRE